MLVFSFGLIVPPFSALVRFVEGYELCIVSLDRIGEAFVIQSMHEKFEYLLTLVS